MKHSYFLSALLLAGAPAFTAAAEEENVSFVEFMELAYPELNSAFDPTSEGQGLESAAFYLNLGGIELQVDEACESPIVLMKADGTTVAAIKANVDLENMEEFEPFCVVSQEENEEAIYSTINLYFSMAPVNDPGKYVISIPDGFFFAEEDGDKYVFEGFTAGYTLVDGEFLGTFESMVYDAFPVPGSEIDIKDEEWSTHGLGELRFSLDGVNGLSINESCESPVVVKLNGETLYSIPASATPLQNAFVLLGGGVAFNDDDYDGFEGDEGFGVDADGQDPEYGGNDSGDDNFGQDSYEQDPEYGGNDSGDDNFGQDSDEQDPEYGGNDSGDDNFGQDSDEQDPEYGGNDSGDDNFGQDSDEQDPEYGGNDPDSDNHGQDSDEQDPEFGGNDGDDDFSVAPDNVTCPAEVQIVFVDDEEEGSFALGTYTLEIPTGFFVAGEYVVEGSTFTYYVVDKIAAVDMFQTEKFVTVYNVNGVRVLNNAPAASLSNLNKGLYIINGKKVIIK